MYKYILALTSIILLASCKESPKFKELPSGPIKHQLIVVAKYQKGVRARGFAGSTPPNTPVFFEISGHSDVHSGPDGSFMLELSDGQEATRGDLTFTVDNKTYTFSYTIKDLPDTLSRVAKKAFTTDLELSYLALNGSQAAILSSRASLISLHDMDDTWTIKKRARSTIGLNLAMVPQLFPRMIAARESRGLVPFSGTGELALIDLKQNRIITKNRLEDKNGNLYLFDNAPPLSIKNPINADGNSPPSTSIARSFAHSPEHVLALDEKTYVASFANYYQFADQSKGDKAVVGPGILALISIENDRFRTQEIVHLPFKNPRYFLIKSETELWVSCSGAYRDYLGSPLTSDDAGLVKLIISADKKSMSIAQKIALVDFSPGEPVLVGSKIVVPLAYGNKIAVLDETATELKESDIKTPNFHRDFNFTLASLWHDDLVFLGSNDGSLVAYSLSEGYFPFPFIEPLRLNPDQDMRIMANPQQLIFRKNIATDYRAGYSALAVVAGQEKIIPLDLLEVFGP